MTGGDNRSDSPLLEVDNLTLSYGRVPALTGMTFHVEEGELVLLLGGNGAGKTSTLRAISAVEKKSGGRIVFRGEHIEGLPGHAIVKRGIAHVPEGRRVFKDHTVMENLEMGGYVHRKDKDRSDRCLERVFRLFPRLEPRRHQAGKTLSGGEAQMLAIGRALMADPNLLMLDEPSLGLAPRLVSEMFEYIGSLREEGISVLLVEQAAAKALKIADRGYVLGVGEILFSGPATELQEDPRVKEVYLGVVES